MVMVFADFKGGESYGMVPISVFLLNNRCR
jgi:hypothetical protein